MQKYLNGVLLIFSLVIFIISAYIYFQTAYAVKKEQTSPQNTPSDYHPLQIVRPGETNQDNSTNKQGNKNEFEWFPGGILNKTQLLTCKSLSDSISSQMNQIINDSTRQEIALTTIAKSIVQYYLIHLLPSGKSLSTYNGTVGNILTQEKKVGFLIFTMQTDAQGFSCEGDNPVAKLQQFSEDAKSINTSLQEYKQSIKLLGTKVYTLANGKGAPIPTTLLPNTPKKSTLSIPTP